MLKLAFLIIVYVTIAIASFTTPDKKADKKPVLISANQP
jgi:hypothetical protein